MHSNKIESFTDLKVWAKAHAVVVEVYELTQRFPKSDAFGLSSQMQRSALSVTSNIAEGFGRQAKNDKKHFYVMSRASLTELQNQLLVAKDTKKLEKVKYMQLWETTVEIHKMLHGLIKSTVK